MAELADAIDLGSISKEWEFKSLYPHQKTGQNLFPRFCPVFMFYNLSVLLNFRYASVAPYVSIKTLGIFSQLSAGTLLNSGIYPDYRCNSDKTRLETIKRYTIFSRFKN